MHIILFLWYNSHIFQRTNNPKQSKDLNELRIDKKFALPFYNLKKMTNSSDLKFKFLDYNVNYFWLSSWTSSKRLKIKKPQTRIFGFWLIPAGWYLKMCLDLRPCSLNHEKYLLNILPMTISVSSSRFMIKWFLIQKKYSKLRVPILVMRSQLPNLIEWFKHKKIICVKNRT